MTPWWWRRGWASRGRDSRCESRSGRRRQQRQVVRLLEEQRHCRHRWELGRPWLEGRLEQEDRAKNE